jgi:glyoxylase-like metal-dependent hydrolase (beta-lactamase superfamily II)
MHSCLRSRRQMCKQSSTARQPPARGRQNGVMTDRVVEVAPDVFLGRGTDVNWYLLRDGDDVTLIDTGYPGDLARVEESVRAIGRQPRDVRAVLLTHAHVDHMGAANHLHDRYGAAVYTDSTEVKHAHRDYLEQANALDVAANLWRPGVLLWLTRVVRVGATKKVSIPSAQPFPNDGPLDIPGAPVPVPTRGHTSGHTTYHLPGVGAIVTGDELVTAHAVLRETGPRVLPMFFNHGDPASALTRIEDLDADLILPGHGDPLRRPIKDAVREAREHA